MKEGIAVLADPRRIIRDLRYQCPYIQPGPVDKSNTESRDLIFNEVDDSDSGQWRLKLLIY